MRDTFEGVIKQLDPGLAGPYFKSILARCFPEFERQKGRGKELGVRFVVTSKGMYDVQQGRRRRYSGGSVLPVSRYYSVCSTANGNDRGTLCYELMTYWSMYASGKVFPNLADTSTHPNRDAIIAKINDQIAAVGGVRPAYRKEMSVLDSDKPVLIIQLLRPKGSLDETYSSGDVLGLPAACELTVRKVSIQDCLDLRLEPHRKFFCDNLVDFPKLNVSRQAKARRHRSTIDFIAALPSLIHPELGGDAFHDQLGATLLRLGYQGFVFPSARNDSLAVSVKDELVEHSGWNFVDYRNVQPLSEKPVAEKLARWPTSSLAELGVNVRLADKWTGHGDEVEVEATGFMTDGVANQEWRRIDYELSVMEQGTSPGFFYDRYSLREQV
jgi:hypothetical protein